MYPDDDDRPTPDENRLDEALRGKFADFELPPAERVWAGVAADIGPLPPPQMAPRRRRRVWLLPLLFMFGAFVGWLGGWLLPRGAAPQPPRTALTRAPGASGGHEKGRTRTPGASYPHKYDQAALPGASYPHKYDQAALPGASYPHKYGRAALPGAFYPHKYDRAALPGAFYPPEYGRAALPGTSGGLVDGRAALPGASGGPGGHPVALLAVPNALAAIAQTPLPDPTEQETRNQKPETKTPPTLAVLIALEHRTLDQLPALPAPDTASRRALARTLRAERHELLRLQRRTDSLLLALGEILPAAPAIAQTSPDTTAQETSTKQPETKKWSLLLAVAPEQNYLGTASALRDEATNLRRNQETGRAGLAAALLAEYQLKPRLSLGVGLGYTRTGAELRQALRTTDYSIRYDTTLTTTQTGYTSVSSTYSIRVVQLPQLSPVFNASGQVVRYDTVYVPRNDTLRSTVIAHDTIRSTRRVVTPLLQRFDKTTYQTLRPDYHFLTLPVLVRYRLGRPEARARWWADVSAGAQLQFFLGGSQLVSTDGGATFRTERVGVADGPFRAFNLALSGSIALNYALTRRVSLSLAPALRWQTLSVFRPETGLRQQATSTGVQVGVRFKL